MIAIAEASLSARWRHQVGRYARRVALPRPLAALGYLTSGAVVQGLVEIENLVLVVLYDELRDDGQLSINVAGYAGARVPWGVQWGGPERSLFFKNLLLRPRAQARGRCLDASRVQLLELALELDRQVDRYRRCLSLTQRHGLSLPRLWGGFRKCHLQNLTADGPELMSAANQSGRSPADLLDEVQRDYEGLALLPLEWVSHHWQRMTAVFADLNGFPRNQVVPIRQLPADLQGFQGAAQWGLYGSRFRPATHELPAGAVSAVLAAS